MAPAVVVQTTDVQFKPAATGSLTRAPSAAAGPRLATVMVYELVLPANTEILLSVFAIVNVVTGKIVVVTVALLLTPLESTLGATAPMVAVLAKAVSDAVRLACAVMVTVQVPPMGALVKVPVTLVLPPITAVAVVHEPPDALVVTLRVGVISGGNVSMNVTVPAPTEPAPLTITSAY